MYFSIPKFRQSSEYETVILAAPSTYLGNSRTARGVILAVSLRISAGHANSSVSPFSFAVDQREFALRVSIEIISVNLSACSGY